jgi:hypothetical protein
MVTYAYKTLPFITVSLTFNDKGIFITSTFSKRFIEWNNISHAGIVKHHDSGLSQQHSDFKKLVPPFVLRMMKFSDSTFRILVIVDKKPIYLTVPHSRREEVTDLFERNLAGAFNAVPTGDFSLRKDFGTPVNWFTLIPLLILFFVLATVIMLVWFVILN